MKKRLFKKKGSTLIVVLSIIFIFCILFSTYLNTSIKGIYTTKHTTQKSHSRNFAEALAILTFDYIRNVELLDDNSNMRKIICSSLMDIDFEQDLTYALVLFSIMRIKSNSGDLLSILQKTSNLRNLKWRVTCNINKKDFFKVQSIFNSYISNIKENSGSIKFFIKISYELNGVKEPITENFLYIIPISVVNNNRIYLKSFNFIGLQ